MNEYRATIAKRRQKVAALTAEGWTVNQIAKHLGVSAQTVHRHRAKLGIVLPPDFLVVIHERRDVVAKLTAEGWTLDQIAKHLGVTQRMISRDRVKKGIAQPPSKPWTADEDRRCRELLADGESLAEVARTLGRNIDTIATRYRGQGWTAHQTGQYNRLRMLRQALDV